MAPDHPARDSEYEAYRDESSSPSALIVTVGKTELRYDGIRSADGMA